ncbi:putative polyamine oxidase 2, partial [Cardiosporidium cionae]
LGKRTLQHMKKFHIKNPPGKTPHVFDLKGISGDRLCTQGYSWYPESIIKRGNLTECMEYNKRVMAISLVPSQPYKSSLPTVESEQMCDLRGDDPMDPSTGKRKLSSPCIPAQTQHTLRERASPFVEIYRPPIVMRLKAGNLDRFNSAKGAEQATMPTKKAARIKREPLPTNYPKHSIVQKSNQQAACFIPSITFEGEKEGSVFKNGFAGLGYYVDVAKNQPFSLERKDLDPVALPKGGFQNGHGDRSKKLSKSAEKSHTKQASADLRATVLRKCKNLSTKGNTPSKEVTMSAAAKHEFMETSACAFSTTDSPIELPHLKDVSLASSSSYARVKALVTPQSTACNESIGLNEEIYDHCSVTVLNMENGQQKEETVTAMRVIVTVPIGVLQARKIKFTPELSEEVQTAIQLYGSGCHNKLLLRFSRVFWNPTVGFFNTANPMFQFMNLHAFNVSNCICAHSFGYYGWENLSDEKVVEQCLDILYTMFPIKDGEKPALLYSRVTRWDSEQSSMCSYGFFATKSVPESHKLFARPFPWVENQIMDENNGSSISRCRIFFAGEHTSDWGQQCVHGAAHSGVRAAAECASSLIGSTIPPWLDEKFEDKQNGIGPYFLYESHQHHRWKSVWWTNDQRATCNTGSYFQSYPRDVFIKPASSNALRLSTGCADCNDTLRSMEPTSSGNGVSSN